MGTTPTLRIVKVTKDNIHLKLSGIPVGFANSLRRIMIAEVPVMSVEVLEMADNTVRVRVYEESLFSSLMNSCKLNFRVSLVMSSLLTDWD
jgi:DNA-directed RNA polymerase alpha subunit